MSNIHPVIRYQDARTAMTWLERAFGFERQAVHDTPDGGVAHAELRFGPSTIGLSSAAATPGDNPWSTVRQGIYAHVSDVDALHARAATNGASIVIPLRDTDYGSREFSVRDPEGHLWGFGTYDMGGGQARPSIFPELRYDRAREAVAWLVTTFGFETALEVPDQAGEIVHAELRLGTGIVMVAGGEDDGAVWGELRQCQDVWVETPDAHHAAAASAGAVIVREPRDTPWGARGYLVRDLEGLLWCFSNYRP